MQNIEKFENDIVSFANEIWKRYNVKLKKKNIVVNGYPRIHVSSNNYREFTFTLWNNDTNDILVVEFPTFIDDKPFCTFEKAKAWIEEDLKEFINKHNV